jgi:hypothetical protein
MSQQNHGHGSVVSYANPRDAKAQAKADKAYRKASRPWFKKKRFWVLGIIVLLVLISALSGGGDDTSATSSGSASDTSQNTAPEFPGAQSTDVVGSTGDELALGAVEVSASALTVGDDVFGPTLCSEVDLNNNSEETVDFSAYDWKLQAPSGTIGNVTLAGSDRQLSTGEIAPGGTATGDVCFDAETAESGQYVVLYEPIFSFFSDRAAWVENR